MNTTKTNSADKDVRKELQKLRSNKFSNIRALPDYECITTRWREGPYIVQYGLGPSIETSRKHNADVLGQ